MNEVALVKSAEKVEGCMLILRCEVVKDDFGDSNNFDDESNVEIVLELPVILAIEIFVPGKKSVVCFSTPDC